jgi:hypothetical protein
MKFKNSSDGLIGMWAHTFDEDDDIDQQIQVIRRSGDVYICRAYDWENGYPADCIVIARNKLLKLQLYESSYRLNLALEKHGQERRLRQQAASMHNVVTFPSAQSPDRGAG